MTTIFRVKRQRDADAPSAIVVNKARKVQENHVEPIMFRFSHTMDDLVDDFQNQADTTENKVPVVRRTKPLFAGRIRDMDSMNNLEEKGTARLRSQLVSSMQAEAKAARYRVIAENRVNMNGQSYKVFDVDVEQELNQDEAAMEESEPFVYDVYLKTASKENFVPTGGAISMMLENENLWNSDDESDDEAYDNVDTDSNDEDNWRNDYPDEEDSEMGSNNGDDDYYY
ncbi:hypothetical protein BC829DRAFT_382287 [Chytridium lagenaria]|nr:hypothetical protein BC829DRAFT_382287 [Chytridium lagenaria]